MAALVCASICALPRAFAEDVDVAEQFAPPAASADVAPASDRAEAAKLRPGQTLKITVYREPDLTGDFAVDENGTIAFPLLGNITVEKRSTEDVVAELTQSLRKYVLNPQVSLVVAAQPGGGKASPGALGSVTMIGEIRQPGSFEHAEDLTLTKLIAEAGGFTPIANTRKIKLIRQSPDGQQITFYNEEDINNGTIEDPVLKPLDKIVVAPEQKDVNTAAILGEVKQAGMYEVTPGFTLMKLIAKAGGFTPLAATSKIRVVRQEEKDRKILLYNASSIINGQGTDPEIKAGDMVFVPESFF